MLLWVRLGIYFKSSFYFKFKNRLSFSVRFVQHHQQKGRAGVVVTVKEVVVMEKQGRAVKVVPGGHRSAGSQIGKLWQPWY